MFQWRRFQFFDQTLVKLEVPDEKKDKIDPEALQGGVTNLDQISSASRFDLTKLIISCSTSGRGRLIFGDSDGYLILVDRDFKNMSSFQAYERSVSLVQQVKQINYLVTIGDDEETVAPTIKIWNLDKLDKNGNPICVKMTKLMKVVVTCLAVADDFSQMAIGLANGSIILFRGDPRDKNTKQITLKAEGDFPVTGLGFRNNGKNTSLFAVTSASVSVFSTNNKEIYREILDENNGCNLSCAVMSDDNDLVIGRKEAVYFYEADGRGPCLAFEGDKKILYWFRSYLVVVGQDPNNLKMNTFNIYDIKNKLIAITETSFQNVNHVVAEWGSIFVLTGDGKIWQFEEKDTQTKLETLFKKNLYAIAISLASSQSLDPSTVVDIYRRYGDHLYSKGDYDAAISQYLKTIGKLEPSYVIRKFLDAQRIHNLTSYLQALHEKGLANGDHTTLLFNCYTKLKDVKKLDEFIKSDSQANFEIETAIKACRQAGYFDHALYLAKRHGYHDAYLKILLEDVNKPSLALEYIQTLPITEVEKHLKNYGTILVSVIPEETTALLMSLYLNYKPSSDDSQRSPPDNFIHIFVNQPDYLIKFLEFIVSKGNATRPVYNTLLELYLRERKDLVPIDQKETKNNNNNNNVEDPTREIRLKKAADLISNVNANYDIDLALVLCRNQKFKEGLIFLYEKLHLYNEIIEYYMENNEYDLIIKACKKYGAQDPNLWVVVLTYFAKKKEDCHKQITEVLSNIDRDNLLPPLLAVQILSQNPNTTLGLIKDYITKRLQQENKEISEDKKQIRSYRDETEKFRQEIQELKTKAFVIQVNKCFYCSLNLDLPAVHFLCKHSFHLRCLGDNENECPACASSNKKILEIKRSLEENLGHHDQFFKQLEGSYDGFNTVADYFGKGVFSHPFITK